MAPSQSLCRTVILTDEPEQNDAFSGPHQRIADAIAGLIQPPDAKGISIGIEGSWGSGKSTVARLLSKKLEADKNIAVISFDAWAHEGDPLRRTFLETIIRTLQHLRWVNRRYWNNRIEQLANRREVVKTKDSLKITRSGRTIAFLLLLVPIGGAFINAALRESVTLSSWPPAFKFILLFIIGLVLTFAPLVVLLLKIKNEPDILGVLFNKGPTQKTTETTKTVNPTSIEFEDNFRKLFKHALARNKNHQRRIVLILDNLDRVDAKDALSIWSTLQTFLQHKGTSRPNWHERVWLLVLYDLQGLSQLWQNADTKSGGKTAVSFIDKSFQIRFEVPALVPSDWSTFLIDQLKQAFPDHTESDWHEVYRALAISVEKGNKLPTIRELKLFVNQIGAIHRQWSAGDHRPADAFPLSHIACYVLLRREGDVIKELFNPGFPQKEYQDLLGSTVRENLAGLAFNVETDVAQQLLFADKIKGALLKRTDEDLKTVASLLRRGFWQTFEQVVTTQWVLTEASNMAEAALELEESGLLNTTPRPSVRLITRSICDAALTVKAWSPMDHDKAKGLAVLIKWDKERQGTPAQHERFIEELFKAIALGLNEHALREDITLNAQEWLDCLSLITHELDQPLKQRALRKLFDTLSVQLQLAAPLHPKQSEPILQILAELQELPDFDSSTGKTLTDLADEGRVAAQLRDDVSISPGAAAWILYILVRYSSALEGFRLSRRKVEALSTESMVETFVGILDKFKQTSLLFEVLKKAPNLEDLEPLVVVSLELALKKPDAKQLFATADAVDRLEFVFEKLRNKDEALVNRLFSEVHPQLDLIAELTKRNFNESNADLYLLILKTERGDQQKFISWCAQGLCAIESWPSFSRLFALAFEVKRRGGDVELGEGYADALTHLIKTDENTSSPLTLNSDENLADLIGPLDSTFRNNFLDELDSVIREKSDLPAWFFPLFGPELGTQLLQSSRGVKVIELLQIVVVRRHPSGLEWLRDLLAQAHTSVELKYSNEPAWGEFKRMLRRTLISESSQSETDPLVKSIASILNVRRLRNGVIAFATADKRKICTLDPTNLQTETLIVEPFSGIEVVSDPSWSPDGEKLAYIATDLTGNSEILIFDSSLGGSDSVKVSSKKVGHPSWSPDGQTLAFVSEEGLSSNIFTIDLETNQTRKLTKGSDESNSPDWFPDGKALIYHQVSIDGVRIFMMNADGSNQIRITNGAKDYDPSWSPDGTRIAFARWDETVEKSGIYINKFGVIDFVQLIQENDVRAPTWSPDSTKLLYQVGEGPEARIFQVDADGKNKKELTRGMNPSWQPILDDGPHELTESTVESTATLNSPR